jgi:hypothetical protein
MIPKEDIMTYNNNIEETVRKISEGHDFSTAVNLYNANIRFYRGIETREEAFIQHPRHRRSISKSNIHTILLSEILPSWSKYPKRNNSIIFSASPETAKQYVPDENSGLYAVFPEEGAQLGISPTSDIGNAFGITIPDMNEILGEIYKLFFRADLEKDGNLLEFLNKLQDYDRDRILQNKDTILKVITKPEDAARFITGIVEAENIIGFLDDYMHPVKNGFRLNKIYDDLSFLINTDYEIWTEESCLMIRMDTIEQ